jgi:hypothetical protein
LRVTAKGGAGNMQAGLAVRQVIAAKLSAFWAETSANFFIADIAMSLSCHAWADCIDPIRFPSLHRPRADQHQFDLFGT